MSNLNIAMVHEGSTDRILIETILDSLLTPQGKTFTLTSLQPSNQNELGLGSNFGHRGGGWGGIYRWCREIASLGAIHQNNTLVGFDLLIFQIDGDVAHKHYSEALGNNPTALFKPSEPHDLPLNCQCPPASNCIDLLRRIVAGWLNLNSLQFWPKNWVFCTPAQCTDTWVLAALFDASIDRGLHNLECLESPSIESWLGNRPKSQRIRKSVTDYRNAEQQLKAGWPRAREFCTQAERFEREFLAVCP